MTNKPIDITGEKHGYLVAVRRTDVKDRRSYLWECRCVCGATKLISTSRFRTGKYKSCGCMEQMLKCKKVVYQGKRYLLKEFAKIVGYSKEWVSELLRQGFNADEIIERKNNRHKCRIDGKHLSTKQIAEIAGVSRQAIFGRMKRGWKTEALFLPRMKGGRKSGNKQM